VEQHKHVHKEIIKDLLMEANVLEDHGNLDNVKIVGR